MDIDQDLPPQSEKTHRSSVGPWHDKQEFLTVYNWLYSSESLLDRQKVYDRLIIWRQRRGNLTSASILATVAILEVMLHDTHPHSLPENVLIAMYSNAFTRFLNYMSSVMQARNLKTMYSTAKELGLDSSVVDLRHLCAHGQAMPSLEMFRRSAEYLLKWVKEFYWDRMALNMKNAYFYDLQATDCVPQSDKFSLFSLMNVYNVVSLGVYQGYVTIRDCSFTDDIQKTSVEAYATSINQDFLINIQKFCVLELEQILSQGKSVGKIFQKAFIENCDNILEVVAKLYPSQPLNSRLLRVYKELISIIAKNGLIGSLIEALFAIAEQSDQMASQRKGAAFWLIKLLAAFLKSQGTTVDVCPEMEELLQSQQRGENLLAFDHIRKLKIHITREVLMERALNINEYTKDAVKLLLIACSHLLHPPQYDQLWTILMAYTADTSKLAKKPKLDVPTFRLQEDVLKINRTDEPAEKITKYGVWEDDSSKIHWGSLPLGAIVN